MGMVNLMCLFLAYKFAPISLLIPISYTRLIFTMIFSYVLYDIAPTFGCLVGAALILLSAAGFYARSPRHLTS